MDISTWTLSALMLTAPPGFTGSFDLSVTARASEAITHGTATTTRPLTVTVLPPHVTSPLVLDLNGDGIHTTALGQAQGTFDLLNTGTAIRSGWLSGEDGFLALDANGNGRIDNRTELFGGAIGEGFARLQALDSNYDGAVDARDTRFAELKIWQDKNENHKTDAGELHTLARYGIVSLTTAYTVAPALQNGNWLLEHSQAFKADGTRLALVDVYFETPRTPPHDAVTVSDAILPRPSATPLTSKWEDKMQRIAQISVHSKPAQPRLADVLRSLSPHGSAPAHPRAEQDIPFIAWTPLAAPGDDADSLLTKKKKPPRAPSWLDDFIGARVTPPTDPTWPKPPV